MAIALAESAFLTVISLVLQYIVTGTVLVHVRTCHLVRIIQYYMYQVHVSDSTVVFDPVNRIESCAQPGCFDCWLWLALAPFPRGALCDRDTNKSPFTREA